MTRTHRRAGLTSLIIAAAVSLSACSAFGPLPPGTADGAAQPTTALPSPIEASGVLRVGTNIPFVPMEMRDGAGHYSGIDLELITAAAAKLRLKVEISDSSWDGLIPALNGDRYDVLAASFGDFVERQKVVDLVDMLHGGVSGVVKAGLAASYGDPTTLCGKTVGVENGSATVAIAQTLSAQCQKQGKSAIVQRSFPSDADGMVALQSGRVDIQLTDRVVAQHLAATKPKQYQVALPDLGAPFSYAFVVSKRNPTLSTALAGAMNELIADGTYAKICAKYGITGDSLVTKATVNAGSTSVSQA